jgi:hypothetical protein
MKKDKESQLRAPFKINFEGTAVQKKRMALPDLILFFQSIQSALERVALVLIGQEISTQPGRRPSEIKAECSLDIIEVKGGSFHILCDLPTKPQVKLYEDIGEKALICLVKGIEDIDTLETGLPEGYDKGVLLSIREGGKLFQHGIEKISFDLKTRGRHLRPSLTPKKHDRIVSLIQGPIENRRTVEGRLLMGDFKETGYRCRIHPAVGKPIVCEFDEEQKDIIRSALTKYVRAMGETKESDGEIRSLKIEDIETIDFKEIAEEKQIEGFFEETNIDILAQKQGVKAITDFNKLLGDFWPEDEDIDKFVKTMRKWRNEEEQRRLS